MVGSSDSVSSPNVVLNTIVAEAFKEAADELEKADDFDMALHDFIKRTMSEHKRIIFSGNGYSEERVEEAERRGLPNLKCGIDSVDSLILNKPHACLRALAYIQEQSWSPELRLNTNPTQRL